MLGVFVATGTGVEGGDVVDVLVVVRAGEDICGVILGAFFFSFSFSEVELWLLLTGMSDEV